MTTNKPEVKRYTPAYGVDSVMRGHLFMDECDHGAWVSLEDYEALQAECEKLRKDAAAALSGLPDSLPMEPYQTVDRGSPHYKAGWNACRRAMLDALEKLMENPINDQ